MKVPSNAEYLKKQILAGEKEIVPIFMGPRAQILFESLLPHIPTCTYLPQLSSPYEYIWPIHGCDIYLVDTGRSSKSFIKTCVLCFRQHGANEIVYICKSFVQKFKRNLK